MASRHHMDNIAQWASQGLQREVTWRIGRTQINTTHTFIATLGLVHSKCKPGWVSWGGRCFYMSTGTKNWWDAKQDCIRRGGRLFEPRNKEVNELVYSNVPGPTKCYWIGISDIEHEDKYVYASDDQPIAYSNFRPGYPVSNATRNCFLYACDRSHPFKVCQIKPNLCQSFM